MWGACVSGGACAESGAVGGVFGGVSERGRGEARGGEQVCGLIFFSFFFLEKVLVCLLVLRDVVGMSRVSIFLI